MADSMLLLASIDDYLGPGETRFFSRGYQRAEYRVREVAVTPAQTPQVQGRMDVGYPADWSRKAGVDQRPHLSTVDALVLGVQLAELHLAHTFGLTEPERAVARLRKVVLRAGGAPQENLVGIQLSARLVESADVPAGLVSIYDCRVGSLRARCEIEHPVGAAVESSATYGSFDALGPGRFYGDGFKTRRHHIRDVRVDTDASIARAHVHFTPETTPGMRGIDGELQPAVTFVDAFVVSLQLVQVLLYELDSLTRADSNTLWMMQTILEAPASVSLFPDRPDLALPAEAALTGKRLLHLRDGIWRSVDISSSLAGIGIRCSFAHELPHGTRDRLGVDGPHQDKG